MKRVPISDLTGGLSLKESSLVKDNQFEELQNMFYDADGRLMSRRGITAFGNPVGTGKPITSYFFFENPATKATSAIVSSGTALYEYNEATGNWASIKTGLTEFEADGVTRTRWTFAVLKNKIYLCNGIDSYAEYDPATTTYTTLAGQPKIRYLVYLADALYGAGEDANPNVMYVTNALGATAVDGRTLNANQLNVGGDERGPINGIEELQQAVLAFKDKRIYNIAGDLSSATALDAENGGYGHRSIERVGNSLVYFNDRGAVTLQAKSGITGTTAIQDKPLSDDIRALTSRVTPYSYNSTVGKYILPLTNYYLSFDINNNTDPDTTIVYSSLTKAWSTYTYPSLYQYGEYKDEDGVIHYVIASATSDQLLEIESGFDDLGSAIPVSLATKKYDFKDSTQWKTHLGVDLVGLKSEGDDIEVQILVDGEVIGGGPITDDYINPVSSTLTIGTRPIGAYTIGGGAISNTDVDLFQYKVRFPIYETGPDIQIKMTSNSKSLVWSLDKINLMIDDESIDLFEYQNIA